MSLKKLERRYKELGEEIKKLKNNDEFPVYRQHKNTGVIVKFTAPSKGIVIRGDSSKKKISYEYDWVSHKDKFHWKEPDVLIDKERDLYHGQPVEFWDDNNNITRRRGLYNVETKRTFDSAFRFDNYKAIVDIEEWMIEAQKTLEL